MENTSGKFNISYIPTSVTSLVLMTPYAVFTQYLSPAILVVGIFGNTYMLVNIIGRRLFKKSPVFIFLLFIAFWDNSCLIVVSAGDLIESLFVELMTSQYCQVKYYFYYVTTKVSVYTLIAAYIFKLRALYRPLDMVAKDQTRSTVVICITTALVFALLELYVVLMPAVMLGPIGLTQMDDGVYLILDCRYSTVYAHMDVIHPMIVIGTYTVIPGVSLIILSSTILIILIKSQRRHNLLTQPERNKDSNKTKETDPIKPKTDTLTSARTSASMLVPMSAVHIATTLPLFTLVMMYNSGSLKDSVLTAMCRYLVFRCINRLNFALNFYVQIVCSGFFRQAMLPWWDKNRASKK